MKNVYIGVHSDGPIALIKDVIHTTHWSIPFGTEKEIHKLCVSYSELGKPHYKPEKIEFDTLYDIAPTIGKIGSVQEGPSSSCVVSLSKIKDAKTMAGLTHLVIIDREFIWGIVDESTSGILV